jgi:hypothetical protein
MNIKIISLVIGAIAGTVIIVVVALIVSRPGKITTPQKVETLTSSDLKTVRDKTSGLENFGNLPIVVSGDDIGRSNPFESY